MLAPWTSERGANRGPAFCHSQRGPPWPSWPSLFWSAALGKRVRSYRPFFPKPIRGSGCWPLSRLSAYICLDPRLRGLHVDNIYLPGISGQVYLSSNLGQGPHRCDFRGYRESPSLRGFLENTGTQGVSRILGGPWNC